MNITLKRVVSIFAAMCVLVVVAGHSVVATAQQSPLATLTLFTDTSTTAASVLEGLQSGHAFVTVKNESGGPIQVGALGDVQPGETVSIGTWGNKSENQGIWYNLESFFVASNPLAYSSAVALKKPINGAQLETINEYINSPKRNKWSHLNNCSAFATGLWNSVNDWASDIWAGVVNTPTGAYYSMSQNGSAIYGLGSEIPRAGRGVLFQRGNSAIPSTEYTLPSTNPDEDLIGSGITLKHSDVEGAAEQWGHARGFVSSGAAWVLSTGNVAEAVGDPSVTASTSLGNPGNSSLSGLAGGQTYDAAAYRATVVPTGTTLHVRYAFATEEFPDYVFSSFNDVMGIFVNGSNCAHVPGTNTPVSVNSINTQSHPEYFIDNRAGASGFSTVFNGVTKVLECSVPVTPGSEVQVEIAVADTGDGVLDSAVALVDGGISSS